MKQIPASSALDGKSSTLTGRRSWNEMKHEIQRVAKFEQRAFLRVNGAAYRVRVLLKSNRLGCCRRRTGSAERNKIYNSR
jgi:hypothetical protein